MKKSIKVIIIVVVIACIIVGIWALSGLLVKSGGDSGELVKVETEEIKAPEVEDNQEPGVRGGYNYTGTRKEIALQSLQALLKQGYPCDDVDNLDYKIKVPDSDDEWLVISVDLSEYGLDTLYTFFGRTGYPYKFAKKVPYTRAEMDFFEWQNCSYYKKDGKYFYEGN